MAPSSPISARRIDSLFHRPLDHRREKELYQWCLNVLRIQTLPSMTHKPSLESEPHSLHLNPIDFFFPFLEHFSFNSAVFFFFLQIISAVHVKQLYRRAEGSINGCFTAHCAGFIPAETLLCRISLESRRLCVFRPHLHKSRLFSN